MGEKWFKYRKSGMQRSLLPHHWIQCLKHCTFVDNDVFWALMQFSSLIFFFIRVYMQSILFIHLMGFPGGAVGKVSACQCRRCKKWGVQSLGQGDPLEKGMATYCSILAWKIPWIEEPGGLQSMGSQKVGQDWAHTHTSDTLCHS